MAGDAGDEQDRTQSRADDRKNQTGGVDALLFLLVGQRCKDDTGNTENDADPAIVGNAGNQSEDAEHRCQDAKNQRNNAHFLLSFLLNFYIANLAEIAILVNSHFYPPAR